MLSFPGPPADCSGVICIFTIWSNGSHLIALTLGLPLRSRARAHQHMRYSCLVNGADLVPTHHQMYTVYNRTIESIDVRRWGRAGNFLRPWIIRAPEQPVALRAQVKSRCELFISTRGTDYKWLIMTVIHQRKVNPRH